MKTKEHVCIVEAERQYLKKYFGYSHLRVHGHFKGKTYTEITAYFNYTKKNGSVVVKSERQTIDHVYCPFCGTKYKN